MSEGVVLQIMQNTVMTVIVVASPVLLTGLAVGLTISIFQTMTSIQEQTLAFVPKILAVFASLIFFGPFMLATVMQLTRELLGNLHTYVLPVIAP